MKQWEDDARAMGRKQLEERDREEQTEREERARQRYSNLQFVPVPTAKSVVVENVVKLFLLVQKRNITPVFEFNVHDLGVQLFGATLRLNDQVFKADGPYPNKKEAKEAVAKLGVEYLHATPEWKSSSIKTGGSELSGGPADIQELNTQCQRLRITPPEYFFEEISKGQFSASLVLAGTSFEEKGPFQNKKLAKEAIAKHGLAHLEHAFKPAVSDSCSVELQAKLQSLVDRHRLDAPIFEHTELVGTPLRYRVQLQLDGETLENPGPFSTKQEATYGVTVQGIVYLEKKYIEDEENWIGLLNLYSQATAQQTPLYEDFQGITMKQNLWASEVIIPLRPEPFGRRDVPFGSKKLARQNAAREAILWLRRSGHLPEDGSSPKKNQKTRNSIPGPESSPKGEGITNSQQVNGKNLKKPTHTIKNPQNF